MPPRLLVAYDGSTGAGHALRVAARLFPDAAAGIACVPATASISTGTAVPVLPTTSPEALQRTLDELDEESRREAAAIAEEGVARAREAGLDARAVPLTVQDRPVWSALLDAARGTDLLVCGSRGRGGVARALLGSTSTSLLHHADVPLLVVPDDAPDDDGPAVLAYDGSDSAKRAIAVAGPLLAGRPAIVVHAWKQVFHRSLIARALERGPIDEFREVVEALEQTVADRATATTEEGVAAARDAGLEVTGEPVESDETPSRTIAAAAHAKGAAVVACGARGLGGAKSALLGSVSAALVQHGGLPVLVVPPAGD